MNQYTPSHTPSKPRTIPAVGHQSLATAAEACLRLLQDEQEFYEQVDTLLARMATANVFDPTKLTEIGSQSEELLQRRDALSVNQRRCQKALAMVLGSRPDAVRLLDLAPHLDPEVRHQLQQQRLQTMARIEATRKLLRRTDVTLAGRHVLFADLTAALMGQPASANCYGANGRRETHLPAAVVEAVS